MPFEIHIENSGESFVYSGEDSLLRTMEQRHCRGIPVGCRSGGCGVCKIKVLSGRYTTLKMSRAHVGAEEEADGYALACRTLPQSDLTVRATGKAFSAKAVASGASFSFTFATTAQVNDSTKKET